MGDVLTADEIHRLRLGVWDGKGLHPDLAERVLNSHEWLRTPAARQADGGGGDAVRAERDKLRAVLRRIQQWDCLNPPDRNLCHDHPWLRRLVDVALGDDTTARIGPGGDLVSDR